MENKHHASAAATAAAPLILWGSNSVRALRAHWMLLELELPYQFIATRPRVETESAEFRAVNPRGKVPVLQHGDLVLTESAAIVLYLAESFPAAGIYRPADAVARARLNEWAFFVMTELDAHSLYVLRRHAQLMHLYGEAPAAVSAARSYFTAQLGAMRDRIASGPDYLLGHQLSAADILLVTCLDWAESMEIGIPTELNSYHARARARPRYKEARARAFSP